MVVLGSIVAGIATPTEAAAIGAAGTMVLAAFAGEMSFANLRDSVLETCRTTGMILFVAIGATCYSVIFKRVGGDSMIEDTVAAFASGPYGTLAVEMILIFLLGLDRKSVG